MTIKTYRPYKLCIASLLGVVLFAGLMIFFAMIGDGLADRGKLLCFICAGIACVIFLTLSVMSLFCCIEINNDNVTVCLGIYSTDRKYKGFKKQNVTYEAIQRVAISYSPTTSITIYTKSGEICLRSLHYGEKTIKQIYSILNEQLAKNRHSEI